MRPLLNVVAPLLAVVAVVVGACGASADEVRELGSAAEQGGGNGAAGEGGGDGVGTAPGVDASISVRFEAECGRRDAAGAAALERDQYGEGLAAFSQHCVSCHGGRGSFAGALSGEVLRRYRTAFGLFDYIRLNMPYYDAGTLTSQEYWDITAFLLASTGLADRDVRVGCGGLPDVVLAPVP